MNRWIARTALVTPPMTYIREAVATGGDSGDDPGDGGGIRNPFEDDAAPQLMAKVNAFVEEINWPARDLSLLRLGAILAKNPRAYLTIPEPDEAVEPGREYIGDIIERDREIYGPDVYGNLRPIDPDEVEHIENERFHRWRQPRSLYFTILNYFWGRRGTIFVAATFCLLTVIGSGCSRTWQQLLTCRLLLGLGMGAKATTVPIFAAESAPAQIRGALVMSWQMWVAFGIFAPPPQRLLSQSSRLPGTWSSVEVTARLVVAKP
ncbi:MAG: hypothetical protein M1813_008487 [Trichoglossum hirsutum]|nr:MAG: hypothetical protein M1813_008487 [Trichoglossum hirsutum]